MPVTITLPRQAKISLHRLAECFVQPVGQLPERLGFEAQDLAARRSWSLGVRAAGAAGRLRWCEWLIDTSSLTGEAPVESHNHGGHSRDLTGRRAGSRSVAKSPSSHNAARHASSRRESAAPGLLWTAAHPRVSPAQRHRARAIFHRDPPTVNPVRLKDVTESEDHPIGRKIAAIERVVNARRGSSHVVPGRGRTTQPSGDP